MSDAPKAITFVRPDPSQFVVLIAKTRGNGIVTGTENFKPSGTDWATDQDLQDAGYVRPVPVFPLLREVQEYVTAPALLNESAESHQARIAQKVLPLLRRIDAILSGS